MTFSFCLHSFEARMDETLLAEGKSGVLEIALTSDRQLLAACTQHGTVHIHVSSDRSWQQVSSFQADSSALIKVRCSWLSRYVPIYAGTLFWLTVLLCRSCGLPSSLELCWLWQQPVAMSQCGSSSLPLHTRHLPRLSNPGSLYRAAGRSEPLSACLAA